jgi:hypothetical protein
MGLLDITEGDPKSIAMLQMGLGLLGSRGSLSQSISQAGQGALAALQEAKKAQMQKQAFDLQQQLSQFQVNSAQRQDQQANDLISAAKASSLTAPQAAMAMEGKGPTNTALAAANSGAVRPTFDMQGFTDRVMQSNPLMGLELDAKLKALKAPIKLGKDDRLLDPTGTKTLVGAQQDQWVPATDVKLPSGQMAMRNMQTGEVKAVGSGPLVTVGVDNARKFGDIVAEKAANSLETTKTAAQASVNSLKTIANIKAALDSGKILSGPGSTFAQLGLQLGNQLGWNGKTSDETLSNTRSAMQGLASLQLDAAKTMQGQGALSNDERKLVADAAAGKIDTMTMPEIRGLLNTLEKTHQYKIQLHQQNLKNAESMPAMKPYLPFYEVGVTNDATNSNVPASVVPASAPSNIWHFDAQGNRIP